MMNHWIDIACIVFACVTAIHLGLVKAIEEIIDRELKVVNCPRCLSCWSVFAYTIITSHKPIPSLAISFLCSYLAIWLELFEGFIDTLYTKLYETIYPDTEDNKASADSDDDSSASPVSQL